MTRTLIRACVLTLAVWVVTASSAGAAELVFSPTFGAGWHLIGLPALPYDESDLARIFDDIPVEYRLYAWDPARMGYVTVDPSDPGSLTSVVSGEGYWLSLDELNSMSYVGIPWEVGAVHPIPLGPAGWHLIGNPHNQRVPLGNCCVIDRGGTERTMADAVSERWITLPMYAWNPGLISYSTVGLLGPPDQADNALSPWAGYWVYTLVDNVRLVVQRPLGVGPFQAWLVGINGMEQDYTLDLAVENILTVVAAAPIYASPVRAVFTGPAPLVSGNILTLFRADSWSLSMPFGKGFDVPYNVVPADQTYDYTVQVEATTATGTVYSVPMSLHVVGVEHPP